MRLSPPAKTSSSAPPARPRFRRRGAVLLEVVIALVLFVAAAAIIGGGLNASLNGVERLRLNTHAANLAVTVLSELQLGVKSADLGGAQPFAAPFDKWTWEVVTTPAPAGEDAELPDASRLTPVEVVIRHDDPPLVFRLSQQLRLGTASAGNDAALDPEDLLF